MNIPVIDISALATSDARGWQYVADSLQEAHTSVGFSVLINHGVPRDVVSDLFDMSARFHRLPFEQKMLLRYGAHLRGYLPLRTSTLAASTLGSAKRPNHSDSFIVLDELAESLRDTWQGSAMGGTQNWPGQIRGFEQAARRYRNALVRLGESVVPCFASMLGLARDGLAPWFAQPNPILRLLHYPALPHAEPDLFGSAPHTDYGCLTFVAQDEVGGLQVQADDGQWLDVPVIENSFVLNTGQLMARWSDGRIKATPHRVLNHRTRDRYSIAFFYDCGLATPLDFEAVSQPDATLRDAEAIYGWHLERILQANYAFQSE